MGFLGITCDIRIFGFLEITHGYIYDWFDDDKTIMVGFLRNRCGYNYGWIFRNTH